MQLLKPSLTSLSNDRFRINLLTGRDYLSAFNKRFSRAFMLKPSLGLATHITLSFRQFSLELSTRSQTLEISFSTRVIFGLSLQGNYLGS